MERLLVFAAGAHDRRICAMRAIVPDLASGISARLFELESGGEVSCQADAGEVAWPLTDLSRGQTRRYRLVVGGAKIPPADGVEIRHHRDERLDILRVALVDRDDAAAACADALYY